MKEFILAVLKNAAYMAFVFMGVAFLIEGDVMEAGQIGAVIGASLVPVILFLAGIAGICVAIVEEKGWKALPRELVKKETWKILF